MSDLTCPRCLVGIDDDGDIGIKLELTMKVESIERAEASPYIVTEMESSTCPGCHSRVVLLAPQEADYEGPSFFLCKCGFVGHVGVGPVQAGAVTHWHTDTKNCVGAGDDDYTTGVWAEVTCADCLRAKPEERG